ncbi:MAG: hypothetical protein IT347_11750 [Candidatus Eisenbacteria bacterium]|nr:hypothetical protein [Candidatus Eisenbacteria bacterium]
MLERLMKSVFVLTLALLLGLAFLKILAEVARMGPSGLISGIVHTTSAFGAVPGLLLALVLVVGVVIRGKDALARLHGRGRHGADPGARYARRHSVTGDPPASRGRGDMPHRRGRRHEVD